MSKSQQGMIPMERCRLTTRHGGRSNRRWRWKSNSRLSYRAIHTNRASRGKVTQRSLLHQTLVKRVIRITYGFRARCIPPMQKSAGDTSVMSMSAGGSSWPRRKGKSAISTWRSLWIHNNNLKRGPNRSPSLFRTKCRSAWPVASSLNAKKIKS